MKYLLLAKSNIRKTKGLTIGLLLLIALAACFLNVFLLINFDFNKNAKNVADKLNSEDVYFIITGKIDGIEDSYLKNIDNKNVKDVELNHVLSIISDLPYKDGVVTARISYGNEELLNNKIGKFDILDSDDSIKENYIYLPYQFYTGGGFKLGDNFKFKILSNEYNLKIKGFFNTITVGSNNTGVYQLIIDNKSYDVIKEDSEGLIDSIYVRYKLNDNVDKTKFLNSTSNKISTDYPGSNAEGLTIDDAISARTFLGVIFGALLLIVCVVVLIIVILMISNNISNFIRENIKTLGALKALGYTSIDIIISFIYQFMIIDIVGNIIGIVLSKYVMQMIGNMMVMQSAIPYKSKFIPFTILITFLAVSITIFITLVLLLRKTKNIRPIVALREGLDGNKTRKNRVPFETSNLPLTINLGIKTTLTNMGQNIVTGIVVFFLIMMSSLSLVLYQNFSLNPKVSIMTFETCDGILTVDADKENEIYDYLVNLKDTDNVRLVSMDSLNVGDAKLMLYVLNDPNKFENKDVVYKGEFPKNDKEIAVSGKFASIYGYKIGDEITVNKGSKKTKLKVTGYIQSLNNSGMESIILNDTADYLTNGEYDKAYYFNVKGDTTVNDIFDKAKDEYGTRVKSTMDFEEAKNGALGTFQLLASAIVILVFIINFSIILLVLYMLIKTLINKKQKDYGILKSLGYTSKQIILQNAISFMPSIIISTIIGSIISCFTMNKIIGLVMYSFGIMKLSLDIPVLLITLMGIIFVLISLLLAILLSRKVKKIEPYKLLIGE